MHSPPPSSWQKFRSVEGSHAGAVTISGGSVYVLLGPAAAAVVTSDAPPGDEGIVESAQAEVPVTAAKGRIEESRGIKFMTGLFPRGQMTGLVEERFEASVALLCEFLPAHDRGTQ
jgi:hypothetical protein